MKKQVAIYINRYQLLQRDGRYLVALSGGADSVALLLVLQELGYHVAAVHCNFHLRGDESDRDEQFVVELCASRGVTLHRAHFDTREYAQLHHVSIEMAARELRYRYFEQLRHDLDYDGICVAHHREDSVETLLINLIRGTGIRGLQGIQPRNGYILRPLLAVSRQNIEDYLCAHQQTFVIDSSNMEDNIQRNHIRLNVIPQLLAVNPAAVDNIYQTAERVSQALEVYDAAIGHQCQQAVVAQTENRLELDVEHITSEPLLYEILKNYGFNAAQVEDLYGHINESPLTNQRFVGKIYAAREYDLVVDRGRIIVERHEEPLQPLTIPEDGTYETHWANNESFKFSVKVFDRPVGFEPSKASHEVHLDAGKVAFPLTLRPVADGDWFIPFGMKGRKLISDYLTDHKVNLLDKRKTLVLCDATGAVLWLVGHRTDNRFRVTEDTERILQIQEKEQ